MEEKYKIAIKLRQVIDSLVDNNKMFIGFCSDLCGLCAIASVALKEIYEDMGLKADILMGECYADQHCWIEIDDQYIDITATQFGIQEKVLVFDKKQEDENMYTNPSVVKNIYGFKGWPDDQKPYRKTINKIKEQYQKWN